MADQDVAVAIEHYIVTKVLRQPERHIDPDTPLISSGLVDSFSLVDLALFVEDAFGVRIEDTELNAQCFDTIGQLASLIQSRRA